MSAHSAHPTRHQLAQKKSSGSSGQSFDMDRAEGGTPLVSAELRGKLEEHGEAAHDTLQILWDLNVWSPADLAGVDSEALVQGGLKRFKVTKLKAIGGGSLLPVENKVRPPRRSSQQPRQQQQQVGVDPHSSDSWLFGDERKGSATPEGSFAQQQQGGAKPPRPPPRQSHSSSFGGPPPPPQQRQSQTSSCGGPPRMFAGSPQQRASSGSFASSVGGPPQQQQQRSGNDIGSRQERQSIDSINAPRMDGSFMSEVSNRNSMESIQSGSLASTVVGGSGNLLATEKGSDAMGALQTLQGMWNVLDGGNVSGAAPENSREDDVRQSNESLSSKSTTLREKDELNQDELDKGVKGGARAPPNGGMSMRMVDHRADRNSAGSGLATMRMHARSREARKRRELEVRKLEEALDADEAADAAGGRGEDGEGSAVDPEDLMRLANRLIAMRQFEAALPYSMRAARRYERRNGRHDHETMMAVMLSAKLLRRLGHVEKAVEQFTLLLGIQEVLLGTDHPEVGNTASALGSLYATNGSVVCDLDRAARCFEQVLRIREKIMYESGVDAIAEAQAAATGEEAGEDGSSGGGGGGGGGGLRGSSQRSGSVHSDNKRSGGVLSSKAGVALALHHLGVVHGDLYHFDDSLAYFMRALKIRRSLGDSAERDTASTLNNMAAVLHQLGRNEQCLAVYGKSLEIKLKLLPPTHPSIADTLYNMGALNLELNRPADASEYFVQALTISTNKLGMNHPLTADLQKQILTCDALADQQQLQEGDGDGEGQDGEYSEYSGGGFAGGGAAGGGGGGGDTALTSRLKQDNGLFSSEYNLNRQGSMASVSTYMSESPESETPPSGGVTPTFGGYGQGGSYGGPPRRSLTGQALSVLATPPSMSPLGLQPTKERG